MTKLALIASVILISSTAQANDLQSACNKLRDAITRYDVNVSIQDKDVKRWNEVIIASRELRVRLGCAPKR